MSAAAVVLALTGSGASASAASPDCGQAGVLSGSGTLVCTYSTVGSDTFTVPATVTRVDVSVIGAAGGNYFIDGDAAHPDPGGAITGRSGGAGGEVAGSLNVTPGQVLQIDVAGRGGNGTATSRSGGMQNGPSGGSGALGGFGGSDGGVAGGPGDASGADGGSAPSNGGNGSGGGGSSDVRVDSGGCAALTCGLGARVFVAGGGGGGGGTGGQGNALGAFGGFGGASNAGCPLTVAGALINPGYGCGGFADGGNPGVSGFAGTASAGGAPGLNTGRHASGANQSDPRYGGDGAEGGSGAGGAGGAGNRPCTDPALGGQCKAGATTSGGGAGGGGGGGYYGGGGGSGGGGIVVAGGGGAGGGGGGGASSAAPTASNVAFTPDANCDPTTKAPCTPSINGGNGQVTVSWTSTASTPLALSIAAAGTAVAGQQSSATATLSGGSGPTGTVTFRLYGPGDTSCQTPLATSTATVSGDGTYRSTAASVATAGTYRWVAGYGGDSANPATSIACADAALVVVAATAPTGPGTPGAPTTQGGSGRGGTGGSGGGSGGRGNGAGSSGSGSPLASTLGKHRTAHHLASRRGASRAAHPPPPPPATGAGSSGAGPASGSPHSRSLTRGAQGSRANPGHELFGLLVDTPIGGTGLLGSSPGGSALSSLQLANTDSTAAGGGVGALGWLGAAVVLALLVAGVLRELDLPALRRHGTGVA
jgi:hypothetical protein